MPILQGPLGFRAGGADIVVDQGITAVVSPEQVSATVQTVQITAVVQPDSIIALGE